MKPHFEKIKQHYQTFERFCISNGVLLAKETKHGYWGVSNLDDLFEFFTQIKLGKHKHLVDLGSGDGRVVLLASLFGTKATGLETDEWLMNCALELKRKIDLPHFKNAAFLQEDFLKYNLKPFDVVFIHPDRPFYRDSLNQKIKQGIHDNAKLVVYGHEFHPTGFHLENQAIVNGEKFTVYRKS